MKIQFWAIGKAHEKYVKEGVEDFTKRISRYFPVDWQLMQGQKNSSLPVQGMKSKESQLILNQLVPGDFLIALDEKGKEMDSFSLSNFLQSRANESIKQIIFIIGGAYGLDDSVLKRADFTWSLSRLTFPHQLVRLILAEQVYRACTIMRNEKYHHA